MKRGILSALVLSIALAPTAIGVNAHYDSTLKKAGIKTVLNQGVEKTGKLKFKVDKQKGYFTDNEEAEISEFNGNATDSYDMPKVTAKDGYVFKGWELDWSKEIIGTDRTNFAIGEFCSYEPADAMHGEGILTAIFEEVEKTVEVTFNVDPEKGYFIDPKGAEVVKFENIDADSAQQFLVPQVEAKEGYVFKGWKGQGAEAIEWGADAKTFGVTGLCSFKEGSTVGYASLQAVFEKVETKKTVNVYFNLDSTKGNFTDPKGAEVVKFENIDADSAQQFLVPQVEAKEGYVFKGWKGQGAEAIEWGADAKTFGVTGLCFFEEGSTVGYASLEAVFEKVETKKTANVYFNVDSDKGYFIDPKGAEVVKFENIDADSAQQFLVPQVAAKEGYVFKGWKGQGAEAIEWGADAKTFGVTGLCHFAQGSNQGYATIEAVFEKVTPEKPVNPSKPDAKPENKPAKKPVTAWDNGGPFTTNAEGDVFDRWGNLIYDAPAASHSSNGYTMVNTSDR